jgi:GDPmannose 4,6-dehydratase
MKTPKKALLTGITGQDGSYLAELLLSKGYEVHGLVRRSSTDNLSRIRHLVEMDHGFQGRLTLHTGDVCDAGRMMGLLLEVEPDEIYNLAAQADVGVSFVEPLMTGNATGLGVANLLEAIRITGLPTRFYQASSSEMFGATNPPQSENSIFYPRSPYGAAKLYGYWMGRNYREAHGLFVSNGILFNHESPRRGAEFVTQKIAKAAVNISQGRQEKLVLGNLDARRDWGYAPEYVAAMWAMLQLDEPDDFVVATGEDYSVREFLGFAFEAVGLDWSQYVEIDEHFYRPTEVDHLRGDPQKARDLLKWEPNVLAPKLAQVMVEAELSRSVSSYNSWTDRPFG